MEMGAGALIQIDKDRPARGVDLHFICKNLRLYFWFDDIFGIVDKRRIGGTGVYFYPEGQN
ncbi:MAG TPA: hypothetical protein DEQ09_10715 [Bacteroidales bacterium]|nr:hypothetical protein [Bacteroidales bacterium]